MKSHLIYGKVILFQPDDPFSPPEPVFDEAWQAQALALANSMVQSGHLTNTDWAEALGAALKVAERDNAPDTLDTYYGAVLNALETLLENYAGISAESRQQRRADWEAAYRNTPHGSPVEL